MLIMDDAYIERLNATYSGGKFIKAVTLEDVANYYTNHLLWNVNLDNPLWAKTATVVLPDYYSIADKLVEDGTPASTHAVAQPLTGSASATYTLSVYARLDGNGNNRPWFYLQLSDPSFVGHFYSYFDVSTGAVGTGAAGGTGTFYNATMTADQEFNDSWWRCSITGKIAPGVTNYVATIGLANANASSSYNGDNVSGLLIFGAQLELATTPGPRITTHGAAVTAPLIRYWADHESAIDFKGNTYVPLHMVWQNIKTTQGMPTEGASISVGNLGNIAVRYVKAWDVTGNTVIIQLLHLDLLSNLTNYWQRRYKVLGVQADQMLATFSVGRQLGKNKLPRRVFTRQLFKGISSDVPRIF